ncbi:hypothetical protein OPQ81_000825 [Rhizoctonia solani]|nr:hypothetical protein OPQ81_000825 [Rhizoctonia solani]
MTSFARLALSDELRFSIAYTRFIMMRVEDLAHILCQFASCLVSHTLPPRYQVILSFSSVYRGFGDRR